VSNVDEHSDYGSSCDGSGDDSMLSNQRRRAFVRRSPRRSRNEDQDPIRVEQDRRTRQSRANRAERRRKRHLVDSPEQVGDDDSDDLFAG
jgi:hypothetical protein